MYVTVGQCTTSQILDWILIPVLYWFLCTMLSFYHSNCPKSRFAKTWCHWKGWSVISCWNWELSSASRPCGVWQRSSIIIYFPQKFKHPVDCLQICCGAWGYLRYRVWEQGDSGITVGKSFLGVILLLFISLGRLPFSRLPDISWEFPGFQVALILKGLFFPLSIEADWYLLEPASGVPFTRKG